MIHTGGCHCGRVRFRVEAPAQLRVHSCNCSICSSSGYLHLIVPASRFELLQGDDALTLYTFGTGTAQHRFCRVCGVKSFYVPRSHPDGYSVNARCLDPGTIEQLDVDPFDGRNWEKNADRLRARSDQSASQSPGPSQVRGFGPRTGRASAAMADATARERNAASGLKTRAWRREGD